MLFKNFSSTIVNDWKVAYSSFVRFAMMVLETDQGSVTRTRRAVKPRDCAANAHTCLLPVSPVPSRQDMSTAVETRIKVFTLNCW
jgi:hypothetical protein